MRFSKQVFLIMFLGLFCTNMYGQFRGKMGMRVEDTLGDMYKSVVNVDSAVHYFLDLSIVGCDFELIMNDFPIYRSSGNIRNQEQHIKGFLNSSILQSGEQRWELRIFPPKIGDSKLIALSEDVRFTLKLEKAKPRADGSHVFIGEPQLLVQSPTETVKGEEVYARAGKKGMVYKGTVDIQIPYKLKGWSESQDLTKVDRAELMKVLIEENKAFGDLVLNGNIDIIAERIKVRSLETMQFLFYGKSMNENAVQEVWEAYALPDKKIRPIDDYVMTFWGDGRIVCLESKQQKFIPALSIDTDFDGIQFTTLFYMFFHLPKGSQYLELIR